MSTWSYANTYKWVSTWNYANTYQWLSSWDYQGEANIDWRLSSWSYTLLWFFDCQVEAIQIYDCQLEAINS